MKHLLVLVLSLISVGCGLKDPYTTETAHFIAYNQTGDDVVAYIDSKDIGLKEKPMLPNLPTEFTLEIRVPKPADGGYYPTAPSSSDDRLANISVNFKITRYGTTTKALTCKAGAKVTTRLFFRYTGSNTYEASCDTI